jgi:uncharacterized delta-60 repeat protein
VDGAGRIYVASGSNVWRFTAAGQLDSSFGSGGEIETQITVHALVVESDGSILAAGSATGILPHAASFAMIRITSVGKVDPDFGNKGLASAPIRRSGAPLDASIHTLAVEPDGQILAGGGDDGYLDLVRFNVDGSVDQSFGINGGIRIGGGAGGASETNDVDWVGSPWFDTIAIRPSDGAIFAAGGYPAPGIYDALGPMTIVAMDANGHLKSSFGTGGVVSDGVSTNSSQPLAMATGVLPLSNGQLIVTGFTIDDQGEGILLTRLNANGSPDSTFAPTLTGPLDDPLDLKVIATKAPDAGSHNFADTLLSFPTIATRNGGFIMPVNGGPGDAAYDQLTTLRFNADGTLDHHYGRHGVAIVTTSGPSEASPTSLIVAPDGSIDVQTSAEGSPLFHLSDDGVVDTSFSLAPNIGEGDASGLQPPDGGCTLVGIQPDGKLLVQEYRANIEGSILARYNADGSVDTSFGDINGVIIAGLGTVKKALVTPSGQIIVDVRDTDGPNTHDRIISISPDGSTSVTYQVPQGPTFSGELSNFVDMGLGAQGNLIVAESNFGIGLPPDPVSQLLRFNATTLAPDSSFGDNGVITLDPAQFGLSGSYYVDSMAVAPDGGLVVVANRFNAGSGGGDTELLRLDSSGQAVASFGSAGTTVLPLVSNVAAGNILVQSSGDILLLEITINDAGLPGTDALARFTANGSADSNFDASSIPNPLAVAVDDSSNGESLLVAGTVTRTHPARSASVTYPQTAYVTRVNL